MGRKKKSSQKRDARGYFQGGKKQQQASSSSSSKTTSVSDKTHSEIQNLLGQLKDGNNNNNVTSSSSPPSSSSSGGGDKKVAIITSPPPLDHRFISRLGKTITRLEELGFSDTQIDQVATSLLYEITNIDKALDWLCLNLNTLELPSLFTDGRLRDSLSTVTTSESITVLVAAPSSQQQVSAAAVEASNTTTATTNSSSREESILIQPTLVEQSQKAMKEREQREREEQVEKDERKKWLLQQYQYDDDDGDDDDQDEDYVVVEQQQQQQRDGEETLIKQPDSGGGVVQKEDGASPSSPSPQPPQIAIVATTMTPEEEYLKEEEAKLEELEADLNNDANNYMRSKQEIKQLQVQVKKLRQQVAGLRKKVERTKAKQQQQEEEEAKATDDDNNNKEEEEEEFGGGGGFFDMFAQNGDDDDDDDETKESSPPPPTTTAATKVVILDYTIPKGWTGTTPEKTLDQVCKKQKLLKPKYTKLPQNQGYRLAVSMTRKNNHQTQPRTWEAKVSDFKRGSSLKDYLATQALYEIDSTVPLYGMFPPPFRDLWLSWLKEKQEEKNQLQMDHNNAKQERTDYLVTLISNLQKVQILDDGDDTTKNKNSSTLQVDDDFDNNNNNELLKTTKDELGDWEDTEDVDDSGNPTPSDLGNKMKKDFVHRQTSSAYQNLKEVRNKLPMTSYRQQVLDMVRENPVTILCAETGAGKTTQCPQYILEQGLLDGLGDQVQVLCTQPRRVAATSVAERVAEEMCEPLGKMVGYQIRMESRRSAQTRLLFCTTGVVLRRLQEDSNLKGVTHVIVDEVHERQQQTDILLVILRQLLKTTRPDLKVILMSATMDSKLFCSFFQGAPMMSVPGRTFPVSSYYLEDLIDATDHVIEEGSRYAMRQYRNEEKASLWITTRGGEKRKEVVDLVSQVDLGEVTIYPGYKMSTRRSMERVNEEVINYDLIEDILTLLLINQDSNTSLVAPDGADLSKGSILVFLPGLGEIRAMTERLEGNRRLGNKQQFEIIPMHSTLSSRDQRKAFVPAKSGCRKIILSTNIAETSVTIPDVICVIDSGRVREVRRNKRTSTSILATDWCSKASAKQRAGRAGRVQAGLCLKLYSSKTAESVMKAASEPELRRVPLEEVCLSILASGFAKSCLDFLNQAPQPPPSESVQAAIDALYDIGAIERSRKDGGEDNNHFEELTPLGQHLAKLPVDVRLGKMLIFGSLFHCIDSVLTIAAGLSSQSPFSTFVTDAAVAKAKQRAFADPESDFITYCNVWDAYCKAASKSASAGRKFCRDNYLNYAALREIGDARRQFLDLLCKIGFLDQRAVMPNRSSFDWMALKECSYNKHANKTELVHAVICAGLYPHVAHLEQPAAGGYSMWHKQERLYFHNTSVNSSKKRFLNSENWVCFFEKFGTPNRTSVSTTCFVHPFALLLFGGSVDVKYTERLVVVDDWMKIGMAAQIGVILRELRKQVDILLQKMIEQADSSELDKPASDMVEGIINILVS